MICPICRRRARAVTVDRTRTLGVEYESERYTHERDQCVTAWRPVKRPPERK